MRQISILKFSVFSVFILLGAIGGYVLNFVIAGMIYPDPCVFHSEPEPKNVWFKTFFDYNGATGYHPEPSLFSMIFYTTVGAVIGITMARFVIRMIRS
jgi:hypothetical protein